jgi:TRAP-type C4-dicarboxylate transport system permease small subunit
VQNKTPQKTPQALVFVAAFACGTLIALVTHIVFGRHGLPLAAPWLEMFPSERDKLNGALAWWAIAAGGGLGGAIAFRILDDTAAFKTLRGGMLIKPLACAAFFGLLVFAGHEALSGPVHGLAFTFSALAATALGAFTAFCGVYLSAGTGTRPIK